MPVGVDSSEPAIRAVLAELARDGLPQFGADKSSDQWSTIFGDGAGMIGYAVVRENVKLIVLRLLPLS